MLKAVLCSSRDGVCLIFQKTASGNGSKDTSFGPFSFIKRASTFKYKDIKTQLIFEVAKGLSSVLSLWVLKFIHVTSRRTVTGLVFNFFAFSTINFKKFILATLEKKAFFNPGKNGLLGAPM
jgi:hypothetical protein